MAAGWGSLLGEVTALAMVVALSPFSVLPAIALVVHSDRPRRTGVAFICGWLAGKAAITLLFVQIPRLLHGLQGTPPHWTAWVRVAAGLLFIAAGIWYWLERRRQTVASVEGPQWLDRIKRITPVGAAAAGAALTVVNPKVVLMCAAAGFAIGTAGLSTLGTTLAVSLLHPAGRLHRGRADPGLPWSGRIGWTGCSSGFATGCNVARSRSPLWFS